MSRLILLCFILLSLGLTAAGQADTIPPPFKQYPTIPAFKLMRLDSTFFEIKDVVQKKRPTVIMIFSPTCSHCQHQTEELTSNIAQLQDVTFVLASPYPIAEIKKFVDDYAINKFPNFHVAYDKGYMLGSFYKLRSLPGIFIYDKKGNLIANFDTNIKIDTLLNALK